jgi:hypothetical protein
VESGNSETRINQLECLDVLDLEGGGILLPREGGWPTGTPALGDLRYFTKIMGPGTPGPPWNTGLVNSMIRGTMLENNNIN